MRLGSREALILSGCHDFTTSGPPIPSETVWAHLVDVLRRHRILGGVCQTCGERAGPESRCFKGVVAARWCQQNQLLLSDHPPPDGR
ncbi:hypothetical protein [Plantactinospora soyae]|uniref:Uncharacterized protein n=1 Tax=Plantactinospora soyae TaxID=1544732 RepID=A0A927R6V3_9ACTN|nr:hypothetical protein [Plantactinospora soyae]MBE1487261.1 hypothetical protein [Plantactinospora soyae]